MKKILVALVAVLSLALGWSCDSEQKYKPSSIGSPYEMILICAQDKWEGQLGDTLRYILTEPVDMINSYEPMFDVMRIMPNSFSDLLRKSSNIVNVITGPEYAEPVMLAQYDVYATPQVIITLSAPDEASLTDYVWANRDSLIETLEGAERDRTLDLNRRYADRMIQREIEEKFGLTVDLPKGWKVRNTLDDFMWLSFEYPTASQGLVIYSYPYSGKENFTVDSLVHHRDRFVGLIPGENPGSHMITFDEIPPQLTHLRFNTGRYWAEMRGFWEVYKDFMGGPFVSYSTVNTETNRVVTFDFYVYSPDKPKRNFLRQLEQIVHSVTFAQDNPVRE